MTDHIELEINYKIFIIHKRWYKTTTNLDCVTSESYYQLFEFVCNSYLAETQNPFLKPPPYIIFDSPNLDVVLLPSFAGIPTEAFSDVRGLDGPLLRCLQRQKQTLKLKWDALGQNLLLKKGDVIKLNTEGNM